MTLLFEPFYTDGLAQLSYLVGDSKAGIAAVIDPRRDIEIYLEFARSKAVRIAFAIETHIHADFVSGVHELASRTGAEIAGGVSDDYKFPLRQLGNGDCLEIGGTRLEVMRTSGHTPEHISLLLHDAQQGEAAFGVFTGDTLFNLDVGRPDLLGHGSEHKLAGALYHTLFEHLLPLGDRMEIFPCHGAGSACGKSIGDRRQSTIGNERLFNPALKPRTEAAFIDWLLDEMPEPPGHYARLKKANAAGASVRGPINYPEPLPPKGFRDRSRDAVVVDTRSILAFGGGHVPGALNIALREEFPNWAGWILTDDRPILLVGETADDVRRATQHLFRIGLDRIEGYLHNGMTDWQNAGLPLANVCEWTVRELDSRREDPNLSVLDVRGDDEVVKGRVPGAKHIFLPQLEHRLGELDRAKTIAVYCGSGYRASIGTSILKRNGFEHVANVPGSWQAWRAADLPVER